MSKRMAAGLIALALVVGAVIGGVVGVFGFIRVVGGSGEPSQLFSAPTRSASRREVSESSPLETEEATGQAVFRIVPGESVARYIVREQDPDATVVGITDQLAGDILVDFDNPARSEVGTIRINLRTLQTDEPRRDETVRGMVLRSAEDQYEFAEFAPVRVEGLSRSQDPASPARVTITGDLTVRGITKRVEFFGEVGLVSGTQMRGFLATVVKWSDFELLSGPLVDHLVAEQVTLEIDFVARQAG